MTSRLKKILCILLSISLLCGIPVFATGQPAATDSKALKSTPVENCSYTLNGSNSAQVYGELTINTSEYYNNDNQRMVKVNYIKVTSAHGLAAFYCSSINIKLRIVSDAIDWHEHDEYKTFSSPGNGTSYYFYPTNNHYHVVNWGGLNSLYVEATYNTTGGGSFKLKVSRDVEHWEDIV
ncbi:MAG: hypothetical protein ACLSAP_02105 [Oscillospiraceae bacterium]